MKPSKILDKLGLELTNDPHKNRRYIAELAIAYTFVVLALYLISTLAAPLLITSSNDFLRGQAALNYMINVYMCHQLPERSTFIFGEQVGICERDFAIFLAALLAYPAASMRKRFPRSMQSWPFVVAALIPIAADGFMQLFGMEESTSYMRFATGLIAGFAVTYFLIASLLDQYSTGKSFFRRGIALPTAIPLALLIIPLLAAGAYVGMNYKSADYVLGQATAMNGNADYYGARYIAPHATRMVPSDPYLGKYSDPILHDVANYREFRPHEFGVWVVLALDGQPEYLGKYIYLSKGAGDYYYFDAWTGQLIIHTNH